MNVAELLEEAISDHHLKIAQDNKKYKRYLEISDIAIQAVFSAAIGGNVTCKKAVASILKLRRLHYDQG